MNILAFDTALDACAAAVWSDGTVLAAESVAAARGHAEMLFPMLARVLAQADLDYADLDRFAVTTGPGSFTGVRVGLAAARGLALGRSRPIIGITTLEAIAATVSPQVDTGRRLGVAIDARRGELYVQVFEVDAGRPRAATPPSVIGHDEAAAFFGNGSLDIAGSGAGIVRAGLGERDGLRYHDTVIRPDAAILAEIASGRAADAGHPPSPLYLRAPDAKLPAAAPARR